MEGIRFETQPPVQGRAPNRVDVACFVGFVRRRRGSPLPAEVERWLREEGWAAGPYARRRSQVDALLDVPVPIESWDSFDRLFEWESRELDTRGNVGVSYLGAAVRSFFAQGGRKCYVVRMGEPWRYDVTSRWRRERVQRLIPRMDLSPVDRETWHGIGHLFGLPEVSFLALPDLPDAVRTEPVRLEPIELPPPPDEQFVECSVQEASAPGGDEYPPPLRAPRAGESGYRAWADLVHNAALILSRWAREVQLVAALPLLPEGVTVDVAGKRFVAHDEVLRFLIEGGWMAGVSRDPRGVASAFVQLSYPWLRTAGSLRLPEGVEPPDGALVGMLARNALLRGTYRSAARLRAGDVYDVMPGLRREQFERALSAGRRAPAWTLAERVSLFGPTPDGYRLLSDVTTSPNESYRPAAVNRLTGVILRAARRLGEEIVFEASSEDVWRQIEERLGELMLNLLRIGALRGRTAEDAFEVRCDRTTMSQNDLDSGRMIARVAFQPSAAIERITVVLAMDEGGQVSLARREAA